MRKIIAIIFIIIGAAVAIIISSSIKKDITISFTGDILLDRGVRDKLINEGTDYPYIKVKDVLKKSDIAVGNLECPLIDKGTPVIKRRDLIFKGDVENADALKRAGYNVLNLANNHVMDYGRDGLINTIKILNSSSIQTVGAGKDKKDANTPLFINKNGIKVGILGYNVFPAEGFTYSDSKPDTARLEQKLMKENIRKAKNKCDFLIVTLHWGNEYSFYPSDFQKEIAHFAVDSGCDVVIGHHPHVLQGVEKYKDKLVFYSLGNFVFDKQIPNGTAETVILNCKIKKNGTVDYEVIPAKIKDCQPTPVYGSEADYVLNRLKFYSERMNTQFYIKDNKASVE